jgi:citrate lyase subunit beta / citryl-CoA lyase
MSSHSAALAQARSFLFVPGHRLERISKALASGAHAVIVDLEDAVAPQDKPAARDALVRFFDAPRPGSQPRLLVRINAPHTEWHEDDLMLLRELAGRGLAAVMLPKAEAVAAIADVAQAAAAPVLALIESAAGLDALDLVARTSHVQRLAFGHLDFQADLGMDCGREQSELDPVRLALAMASRRAGLPPPVDGVTVALDDEAALAADIARSRRFGFAGKLCIHPRQVAAVNEGLGPTSAQRAWAQRVLDADRANGQGAFRLDGEMIDAPVLRRARAFLAA